MQASKRGACRGHQGIKQRFASDGATPPKSAPAQTTAALTSTGGSTTLSAVPPPQPAATQTTTPRTRSTPIGTPLPVEVQAWYGST